MDVRHRFTLGGSLLIPGGVRMSPFIIASSGRPYNIITGRDNNGDTIFNDRPAYASDPSRTGVVLTQYGLLDPNPAPGDAIVPRNLGRGPSFVIFNLRLNRQFALKRQPPAQPTPQTPAAGEGDRPGQPGMRPGRGAPGGGGGGGFGHGGFGGDRGGLGGVGRGPTLTISMSVQNAFNHVNPGPPIGNIASPNFGRSISTAGGFGRGEGGSGVANRRVDLQLRLGF
jgi:hypothetical protein